MSDDGNRPPEFRFEEIKATLSQSKGTEGLPGVAMRVSSTSDNGVPTFMFLSVAKKLRDQLDAAIRSAEAGDFGEPPFEGYTMDT